MGCTWTSLYRARWSDRARRADQRLLSDRGLAGMVSLMGFTAVDARVMTVVYLPYRAAAAKGNIALSGFTLGMMCDGVDRLNVEGVKIVSEYLGRQLVTFKSRAKNCFGLGNLLAPCFGGGGAGAGLALYRQESRSFGQVVRQYPESLTDLCRMFKPDPCMIQPFLGERRDDGFQEFEIHFISDLYSNEETTASGNGLAMQAAAQAAQQLDQTCVQKLLDVMQRNTPAVIAGRMGRLRSAWRP